MTTVHVARNVTNSDGKYHTRECKSFPENDKQWSLERAERRGLTECKYCSGEYSPATVQDWGPQMALRRAAEASDD